jgi:GTP-binding protein
MAEDRIPYSLTISYDVYSFLKSRHQIGNPALEAGRPTADKASMTEPESKPDFLEAGRKIFAGQSDFIWAADSLKALPLQSKVEIAFAGRSNVGKSSLVNALTGRNTLARTSHTPGRTQQLNFFNINDRFHLVDMPGYGYAAVEKEKVQAWTRLIHDYLRGRASLARVYLLIDSRHGIKPVDEAVLETLDKAAVSYQIVLTKADELKQGEIEKRVADTAQRIAKRAAAFPEIVSTSSRTGTGIPELRAGIAQLLAERGEG